MGGKEKNKHADKKLKAGRGAVGKAAVVGMKDRETNQISAEVVESTDGLTLQEFVLDQVVDGAKVYTDEHRGYHGLPNHQTSITPSASMWTIKPTPTVSSPSGPCSRGATTALITK